VGEAQLAVVLLRLLRDGSCCLLDRSQAGDHVEHRQHRVRLTLEVEQERDALNRVRAIS